MVTIILPNKQRKEVSNWPLAVHITKTVLRKQLMHNKILGHTLTKKPNA